MPRQFPLARHRRARPPFAPFAVSAVSAALLGTTGVLAGGVCLSPTAAFAATAAPPANTPAPVTADTVSGRLVGDDGKPLAGATLYLCVLDFDTTPANRKMTPARQTATATTDASGAFQFTAPVMQVPQAQASPDKPPKFYGIVTVVAPGYGLIQHILTDVPNSTTWTLRRAVSVTGSVVGDDKKPLTPAPSVALMSWEGPKSQPTNEANYAGAEMLEAQFLPPALRSRLRVTADAAGHWRIDGLPGGGTARFVVADNRTLFSEGVSVVLPTAATSAPIAAPVLTARVSGVVTGKVVGLDGKPVAGAVISVYTEANRSTHSGDTTGPDGTFTLSGLPDGKVVLQVAPDRDPAPASTTATTPRYSPANPPLVPGPSVSVMVTTGKTVALSAPLTVVKGIPVEGTVTEVGTGAGIADYYIYVQNTDFGDSYVTEYPADNDHLTDKSGHFRVYLPPGGHYRIQLSTLTGKTPDTFIDSGDVNQPKRVTIPLTGESPAPLAFKLTRGLLFTGTLQDESGKPLSAVRVHLGMADQTDYENSSDNPNDYQDPSRPKSDKDGKWRIAGMSPYPEGFRLSVEPQWEVVSPVNGLIKPAPGVLDVADLTVVLKRRTVYALEGQVVDTTGKPIPTATLGLYARVETPNGSGGSQRNVSLTADKEGRYRNASIRPEEKVTVSPWADGYRFVSGGAVPAKPDTSGVLRVTPLVMARLSAQVRGRVVDGKNKPVAGARVWCDTGDAKAQTMTDAAGVFTLVSVPAGSITVSAASGRAWGQAAATTVTTAAAATGKALPLVTVVLETPAPPVAAAAADDTRAVVAALTVLAEEQKSEPYFDRSELVLLMARLDPEAAYRVSARSRSDGIVPPGVFANLVEERIKRSPEGAAAWAAPYFARLTDDLTRVRVAGELGIALAVRQPGEAARWYQKAMASADTKGAARDINRARLVALSALLRRTDDEAEHLRLLHQAVDGPNQGMRERCAAIVARGDVPAAEAMLEGINAAPRALFYDTLFRRTVKFSPTTARGYFAKMQEAAAGAKTDYWVNLKLAEDTLQLIGVLGPTDPKGALAVAQLVPEESEKHFLALATAARFQPPAVADGLWAAAQKEAAARDWNAVPFLTQLAVEAGRGPSPETRARAAGFWTAAKEAAVKQNYQMNQVEGWALLAVRFDPALTRMVLEKAYAEGRDRPVGSASRWQMASGAVAMSLLDEARANALLEALPAPDKSDLAGSNGRDSTLDDARFKIVRLRTLTPAQRDRLTWELMYQSNFAGLDDDG